MVVIFSLIAGANEKVGVKRAHFQLSLKSARIDRWPESSQIGLDFELANSLANCASRPNERG